MDFNAFLRLDLFSGKPNSSVTCVSQCAGSEARCRQFWAGLAPGEDSVPAAPAVPVAESDPHAVGQARDAVPALRQPGDGRKRPRRPGLKKNVFPVAVAV